MRKSGEDVIAQERQESKYHDRAAEQNDHIALALGEAERIQVVVRFVDPGALDELQVVEQCNHVVQNGECDERVMTRRCTAEEQVELSEETGKRRNACQAEYRTGKCNAKARVLLRKSAERIECFFAVVSDDAEYEEREVVRNGVDEEVIDD